MKTLHKESLMKTFILAGVVCALALPAFGATSSKGCDNPNNDRINPEIALCSTHVYNIGGNTGPDGSVYNFSDESNQQLMRDVIALKTTVMTQQMYKQYEYLDATLKRFKTQLEKAVLTTKLAAAGADVSSGSSYSGISTGTTTSSFRSSDRNIFIAGVNNCNNELSTQKVYECLHNNLNTIYNASNNGQNVTSELKKQLANDYNVASNNCECKGVDKRNDCKANMSRETFRNCLDSMRNLIRKGNEESSKSQQNMTNRYNPYGG